MKSYTAEIVREIAKTVVIEVPDDIKDDDVEDWVLDNLDDIFDLERYQGKVQWTVSDLRKGEKLDIHLRLTYEDDGEYDLESLDEIQLESPDHFRDATKMVE